LLQGVDLQLLRGKIAKAQAKKKEKSTSMGGSQTKRILIHAAVDTSTWNDIVLGNGEKILTLTEDDIEKQAEEFSP
jgi:hypothetical protein